MLMCVKHKPFPLIILIVEILTVSFCSPELDTPCAGENTPAVSVIPIFVKALKEAELVDDVLTIECESEICHSVGFPLVSSSSTKFLFRKDYKRLWIEIMEDFACSRKSIVVGAAGIGKSLFRFYLIWKWFGVDEDISGIFKDVRFNSGRRFYSVRKDGTVLPISNDQCLMESRESLVLLDPCPELSGIKDLMCKLLIVTSSPSALIGHSAVCSLSQLRKLSTVYVMKMWTEEEWYLFSPGTDKDLFSKFSSRERLTTYCVPRWLTYRPKEIEGQLKASLNDQHAEGLVKYLLGKRSNLLMGSFLPYSLCKVHQPGYNQWEVYGFISDYVTSHILWWAGISDRVNKSNFLNLLHNPWSGGLLGHCYKNWAFEMLEAKSELIVYNKVEHRFHFNSTNYFSFIPRACIPCILDGQVLQRPDQGSMPSIDAYGMVGNTLLLLQFTVGLTHSGASWKHVGHIVNNARNQYPEIQVLMVYVVPEHQKFTIPKCKTLEENQVHIAVGQLNADFFTKAHHLLRQRILEASTSEEE
jgi:hypothetical protein